MALARNLEPNRPVRIRGQKKKINYKKTALYLALGLAVLLGIYGIFNLSRLAPAEEDKKDVVFSTGDKPLPEEIRLVVNASGGLNMRAEPDVESEILKTIPNGTELVAKELSGDWYKVTYESKSGWVHRDYVRVVEEERSLDTRDGWKTYQSPNHGFSVSYPKDWVSLSYGANRAANLLDYVAFGPQLSDELDPTRLPPVVVKVTDDTKKAVSDVYNKKTDVSSTSAKIAGIDGSRYVYRADSGVQMTAYIVSKTNRTYILEESGGYTDELKGMVDSFRL